VAGFPDVPDIEPTVLLGQWELIRWLRDQRAGMSGTAAGRLTLSADREQIDWHEQATLQWNGHHLPVSRSYRLHRTDDGWWAYFPDGRPFHPWRPGQWVQHACRADIYYGLTTLTDARTWYTRWDVVGPAKSQRIITRLSRAGVVTSAPSLAASVGRILSDAAECGRLA
jgi:hypothetical protein